MTRTEKRDLLIAAAVRAGLPRSLVAEALDLDPSTIARAIRRATQRAEIFLSQARNRVPRPTIAKNARRRRQAIGGKETE